MKILAGCRILVISAEWVPGTASRVRVWGRWVGSGPGAKNCTRAVAYFKCSIQIHNLRIFILDVWLLLILSIYYVQRPDFIITKNAERLF